MDELLYQSATTERPLEHIERVATQDAIAANGCPDDNQRIQQRAATWASLFNNIMLL
jgi:hypothetical protein